MTRYPTRDRKFKCVAVLMGGPSSEREISLKSGAAAARGLREAGYAVREVDIQGKTFELPPDTEAAFIAMHGAYGEDGQVQSILENMAVPYTGSGPRASRRAMSKIMTKQCLDEAGIPTPGWEVIEQPDERTRPLPVAVKPPLEGSSIGVHCVFDEADWPEAARDTLRYGGRALVEDYIPGRELTAGIVDGVALPLVEIRPRGGLYDFRAKYEDHDTEYLAPAPVDENIAERCRKLAMDTFKTLGCKGFGRVDLRLSAGGALWVLEMNTIPGLTETSLLPKAAAAYGWNFSALCDRIVSTAALESNGERM